jgi:hypothetical protein
LKALARGEQLHDMVDLHPVSESFELFNFGDSEAASAFSESSDLRCIVEKYEIYSENALAASELPTTAEVK